MYKFKKIYLIMIFILWFWFLSVFAHNPRIVWNIDNSIEMPFLVQKPEESQAFYAQLKWKPDFYKIYSDTNFLLYLSITVPAISSSDKDYWIIIKDSLWNVIDNIDSNNLKWTKFYEKFAWDLYYQWPWFEKSVNSWTYYIQIYSSDNMWKYALAIWKLEIWPIKETLNTFKSLPALKSYFFEKSVFTMFFNYIWVWLFAIILFIISTIILINKLIKKFK
jgi:hypothetical protein